MTLADVADLLKVSEKTVSRMLQDGSIPGFKVANQWRFYREDLRQWIDRKRRDGGNRARAGLAAMLSDETGSFPLSRLTEAALLLPGLSGPDKWDILETMVESLVRSGSVRDSAAFLDGLQIREDMMSTGVGGGVAIPHLRNPADLPVPEPRVVIATCPRGVDWQSFDGHAVRLVVLPASPDEAIHLKILSSIRRTLAPEGVIESLVRSADPDELLRELMKIEARLDFTG